MAKKVRLRFAPSPTGPLHIGGVRTALFSYLYAKQNNGDFVLRIEDTDRNRYVEGAEQYIEDCLAWAQINPDESPSLGGEYGPYRQSERLDMYRQYADQLLSQGWAYYAWDTTEEIEEMKEVERRKGNPSPNYGHGTREKMKNSLNYSEEEARKIIESGQKYVIRFKVPENVDIEFADMIRGDISISSNQLDDKVLIKNDGFPTYHLAVVVDDYLMKISHVFRGEEWLPSAPFHVLLWDSLGWKRAMPQMAHLPLIMKTEGQGKLSKRDAEKHGYSVFPLDWKNPENGEETPGYDTLGFLPSGFDNMLLMLGWHPRDEKEIFSMEEMLEAFRIEDVSHAGARFDYAKGVWYNQQHFHRMAAEDFLEICRSEFLARGWDDMEKYIAVAREIHERISLRPDICSEADYFFRSPELKDKSSLEKNWDAEKRAFFQEIVGLFGNIPTFTEEEIEKTFKDTMKTSGYKPGQVMLPFRIMLVGEKRGVGVFKIAEIIGKEETINRINTTLDQL